jgi:trimeric autotransporter adhesin
MRYLMAFVLVLFCFGATIKAQYCLPATSTLPISPTSTTQFTPYYSSGAPVFSIVATAGCAYSFATCGESTNDTFLRLYNSSLVFINGDDDHCGQQSSIIWICPANGTYFLQITRFPCQTLTAPTRLSYVVNCNVTSPCSNPLVNAGPDVSICPGNSQQLAGSVINTSSVPTGIVGPLIVSFYGWTNLDMLSWTLTNAAGVQIGSGGPTNNASVSTTINSPGPSPYSFFVENGGSVCDNSMFYFISNNGINIANGYMDPCNVINISVTAGALAPITYSWSPSSTLSSNNILNPIANPSTTTTYTLTATQGTCSSQDQVTVVVYPLPSLSINSNTTVLTCNQPTITLNAIGSGTFSWSNGAVPLSTGSSITVSTPGIYSVEIQDQNGCVSTSSITITQDITLPTASIATNPNTQELTCNIPSISLIGSGGNTYSWSNGNTVVSNSNIANISTPGSYTLSVAGSNGCIDTAMINIIQNITPPIASISSNVATNTLNCTTTSITLTAGGGISYTWSNGPISLGTANQIVVNTAGTYTLTATGTNGCTDSENIFIDFQSNTTPIFNQVAAICTGNSFSLPTSSLNGIIGSWSPALNFNTTSTYTFTPNTGFCANPVSMTVAVNPYPVISAQNDTICAGQTGTVTTQTTIGGGTYNWSGTQNTASSISLTLNSSNSVQVIYTVSGCADTANAIILVNPIPQVTVNNATICIGQTGTISASSNLPNGTYQWSNGSNAPSQTLSPLANTNYSVIYSLNGCISVPTFATITVLPVPSISVNSPTICFGDPATLITSANPSGGNFYWGPMSTFGNSQLTITPNQDTIIPVYNELNGCFSDTVYAQITVNPLPLSNFSASINQGCVPITVVFSPDNTGFDSYTWEINNQNIGSSVPITYDFLSAGTYNIELTTTLNGCTVTTNLANPILVEAYPIASFNPSSDVFIEPNQSLSFWNNSSGAQSYFWDFGDGTTSTEFAPSHLFNNTANDQITVTLVASSNIGCMDTSYYLIEFNPGLVYYIPNSFTPDGDQFNNTFTPIFTYGIDANNYLFEIYNRWGELIFASKNPAVGWDGTYSTNGFQCQDGTYLYKITFKLPSIDERRVLNGHVNLIR